MWQDNSEYNTVHTAGITVSAFHEELDADDFSHRLWGYCLRIENNSDVRIRLLKKDFCITDNNGECYFDQGYGFNGELPDLEPGECFEFEDTIALAADAAVLYGYCVACVDGGDEIKIKLPVMQLTALEQINGIKCH